jgi:hypothetical protein
VIVVIAVADVPSARERGESGNCKTCGREEPKLSVSDLSQLLASPRTASELKNPEQAPGFSNYHP